MAAPPDGSPSRNSSMDGENGFLVCRKRLNETNGQRLKKQNALISSQSTTLRTFVGNGENSC